MEGPTVDYLERQEVMGRLRRFEELGEYAERLAAAGVHMSENDRRDWLKKRQPEKTKDFQAYEAEIDQINDWMMGHTVR